MKLGLVPKLIIAIIAGILIGMYLPLWVCQTVVTASGIFSTFLKFVIPLMIVAYVTMGIADLSQGAGKLLIITVILAYGSTLIAGSASFIISNTLSPALCRQTLSKKFRLQQINRLQAFSLFQFLRSLIPFRL